MPKITKTSVPAKPLTPVRGSTALSSAHHSAPQNVAKAQATHKTVKAYIDKQPGARARGDK